MPRERPYRGAKMNDPEMRRLRALMMLDYKLRNNASNKEVAKEFNMAERTVDATFSWLRKAGMVAKAEDKILEELVPLAHMAIKKALEGEDIELASERAMEIFKGILPTFGKRPAAVASSAPGGDLSSYITQLRDELGTDLPGTIEGEVVPALPAAAEAVAEEGHAEPAGGVAVGAVPAA